VLQPQRQAKGDEEAMVLLLLALALPAAGGPLRDWLQQRAASHDALGEEDAASSRSLAWRAQAG
jgi:hypothetical protein